jgi:hypothetical protein
MDEKAIESAERFKAAVKELLSDAWFDALEAKRLVDEARQEMNEETAKELFSR